MRRSATLGAVMIALLGVVASALPAVAAPSPSPSPSAATDSEGQSQSLDDKLAAAAKGYYDVRNRLLASQQRQTEIKSRLATAQQSLTRLSSVVGQIAAARYKGGQISTVDALIVAHGDTEDLLQGAAVAYYLIWRDDQQLRAYAQARQDAKTAQTELTAEIANEQNQYAALDQAKRAAEKALAGVGGMISSGFTANVGGDAQPVQRNADGTLPVESCSIKDPTSDGCIKPRMYHALTEARLAGFTRFTHCWRQQSWGEHPLGQACDFSVEQSGFGGVAVGDQLTYGNALAAWLIHNSDALAVMYVIWFRQIWMPGIGWRSYFGCCDPSSEHENHVHLSVL
jgi:hypothetical protein